MVVSRNGKHGGFAERQDAERAGPLARPSQKAAEETGHGSRVAGSGGNGGRHSERSEESLVSRSRAEPLYKEAKDSSLRSE
jgi:hypothetical protein